MGNSSKSPPDPEFNARSVILFVIAFLLISFTFAFRGGGAGSAEVLSYPQFSTLLGEGKIISTPEQPVQLIVEENRNTQTISGQYQKAVTIPPAMETVDRPVEFSTTVYMPFNGESLQKELAEAGVNLSVRAESNLLGSILFSLFPLFIILLVLFLIFRSQMNMTGRGPFNLGKSKARMLARENPKTTFKDVAGVEEAKEEVSELVDFLKDPKKFQNLGGRIPKGVLMVGAPGTGKTLLARAIAGEADVPFFSISGSDFVEMFVGVGASRVRDMFEQGRKNAPCIIFIDEIDAVGRHRGHGMGGGHDEREQTLNALLVEMDGFDAQDGVIIIAATNRGDVLDPALLRPGRFDRQVTVSLPDVRGREEILKVHGKKVKIADTVDFEVLARGTPGYSGAELANVINEAALLAARRELAAITNKELEEARDKVRWGKERRSLAISEKEKEVTAYHEAGHALMLELLEHSAPLHKVTIIPRGPSLGSTMWLPEEDQYHTRRKELLDHLAVIMGGRVAEDIVFGDVTSGARGDIKQATSIARKMVCQWGMSDKLGMIEYGEGDEHVFLARDFRRMRDYSEATAQAIDNEVKELIDVAYARATKHLQDNRSQLNLIAKALLEHETLDGAQIRSLIRHGSMEAPDPPASGTKV